MTNCRAIENSMLRPVNSEVPMPISANPPAVEATLASNAACPPRKKYGATGNSAPQANRQKWHGADRVADLDQRRAQPLGARRDPRALLRGQRQFGHAPDRPDDRPEGQDRADHEHDARGIGDMVAVDPIRVHARPDQQRRREEGEHLRQPGKGALGQEADIMLALVQPVGDIGAVRLHGDVVARVQDPEQRHRHQDRRTERHEEQAQRAQHRADQEIGRAPAPAAVGPIAHGADQRLDEQPRHRPGQLEQRNLRFRCTEITVDRRHIALLQPEAELQAQKAQVHLEDADEGQARLDRGHGSGGGGGRGHQGPLARGV